MRMTDADPASPSAPEAAPPASEADAQMDIHKPKPVHSWRELASEIGVIVIGILIAIGLEQTVEQIHWAHQVRQAHAELATDMAQSNRAFAFRAAADGCIARRIDRLEAVIEQVARHEPVARIPQVIPDIGNGLYHAAWQTNQAAQTLAHFDERELNLYGNYYIQIENVQRFIDLEGRDWNQLRVLQGDPARLGPGDIASLRVAIQQVRFENYIIASIMRDEMETSRALGVAVPAANAARVAEVCAVV